MFHGEAPGGGLLVAVAGFHCSEGLPVAQTEQSKNDFARFDWEVQAQSEVMEAFARGASLEAAAGPVIEMMEGGFQLRREWGRRGLPVLAALIQSCFEVADALFHGAIVAGIRRWIVERQDPIFGQDLIDFVAVEGRTVVALEEQGRAVLFEGSFEEGGDLRAVLGGADDGIDAVA